MNKEASPAEHEEILQRAAEQLILADPGDPSSLEGLQTHLQQLSHVLAEEYPRCSRASSLAAETINRLQGNESGEPQKDLSVVDSTLSVLQSCLLSGEDEEASFPPELGLEDVESSGQGNSPEEASLDPAADQDMMEAFISQQEAVIPEMEDDILAYEKDGDEQALGRLQRTVHTMKGEAGVMGLDFISRACHRTEDFIREGITSDTAEVLLTFKDWLEQVVQALRQEQELPSFEPVEKHMNSSRHAAASAETSSDPGEVASGAERAGGSREIREERQEEPEEYPALSIEDPELAADFVSESQEHFDVVDENLITLESDPGNDDALAAVFRAFHTIKGTCNFLGITPVGELAHKAENVLDALRKGDLQFKGPVVEAVFGAQDMLKKLISGLSEAVSQNSDFRPDREMALVDKQLQKILDGEVQPEETPSSSATGTGDAEEDGTGETVDASPAASNPEPEESGSSAAKQRSSQAGPELKQSMKIDADKIDNLLDTIGELVIVESMVSQDPEIQKNKSANLDRHLGQLNKIARSLQDMGMSMRMIPIEATFRKMARLVRDLSRKSGKNVELSLQGKETELDKAMVEKLGDPLVHMVRNAVDHGIESSPEERKAAGKPPEGHITLRAYQEGGSIHIAISDDGRGLDRESIAAKAVERGLISSSEDMSDEEVFALIFEPGFSTSSQVTDVSGRGVGMDVVKSTIEGMRGNIRISSEPGRGSTFTLVLPLTMAIIEGMVIRLGKERYILPLLSIVESFRPGRDMVATVTGKGETVPFRGHLLPLYRLAGLFGVRDSEQDPEQAILVVVEHSGRQVALMVDELLGQNQTVIKSLGEALGSVEGIAGASIMPDGSPGLIIDVNDVIKLATRRQ